MQPYASTFITGLKEPAAQLLKEQIPEVQILDVYDGFMVYRTTQGPKTIGALRFFSNSFFMLYKFSNLKTDSVELMIEEALRLKDLDRRIASVLPGRGPHTFRIITSQENHLVSVDKRVLRAMEQRLERIGGLKPDRAKPELEFWFLYRSEGVGFFMLRLTKHPSYSKTLQRGELRPDLCHFLCRLSEPQGEDVFLDPFCGYGAIPIARARTGPYNLIFLSDKSKEQVRYCKTAIKELGGRHRESMIAKRMDALNMEPFEPGFIHKVVTDPPWGLYEDLGMDLSAFYGKFLDECIRIVLKNGLIIVLTAQKEVLEASLKSRSDPLKLLVKYDILVSGKKAAVYKLQKQ